MGTKIDADTRTGTYRWQSLHALEETALGYEPPIRLKLSCDVCDAREPIWILRFDYPSGYVGRDLICQHCRDKFSTRGIIDALDR